jgi:hypothetical protein
MFLLVFTLLGWNCPDTTCPTGQSWDQDAIRSSVASILPDSIHRSGNGPDQSPLPSNAPLELADDEIESVETFESSPPPITLQFNCRIFAGSSRYHLSSSIPVPVSPEARPRQFRC